MNEFSLTDKIIMLILDPKGLGAAMRALSVGPQGDGSGGFTDGGDTLDALGVLQPDEKGDNAAELQARVAYYDQIGKEKAKGK